GHGERLLCPAEVSILAVVPAVTQLHITSEVGCLAAQKTEGALVAVGAHRVRIGPAADRHEVEDFPTRTLEEPSQSRLGEYPEICRVIIRFKLVDQICD